NQGSRLHYEPNSYGEWQEQPDFSEPPLALEGAADRYDFRADDSDYFTQPGDLLRLLPADDPERLFHNTARAVQAGEGPRLPRHPRPCALADPADGAGIARALGLTEAELKS